MEKLNYGKFLLFALISIMFLQSTEMNAQYNRTTPQQRSRTNVSIDGNELLGRLFKKNKDKEKSKKEKNDKKAKEKKGDVDNSLRNENNATTRIVEPQLKESSPLAEDEVSLIVSGDGSTKENATKAALRSAIELAFGTFVSSNTQILNDELVKDEIITVSSGNIKNYQYLSEKEENGKYYVTMQTTVVIGKLIEYTKTKGASAELAGAAFAMNLKLKEIKKQNISKALKTLEQQIRPLLKNCFSFEDFKVGEPSKKRRYIDEVDGTELERWTRRYGSVTISRSTDEVYVDAICVPIEIYVKPNINLLKARIIANKTADALAEYCTPREIDNASPVRNEYRVNYMFNYGRDCGSDIETKYLILDEDNNKAYSKDDKLKIRDLIRNLVKSNIKMYIPSNELFNFKIIDNLGEYTYSNLITEDQVISLKTDPYSRLDEINSVDFYSTEEIYYDKDDRNKKEQRFERFKTEKSASSAGWRYYISKYYNPWPLYGRKNNANKNNLPFSTSWSKDSWDYQCKVIEGYRDVVAYVMKINLWYTVDEISQISEIKVVSINE